MSESNCEYTQTYWPEPGINWKTNLDGSYPIAFDNTTNIFYFGSYYGDNTKVNFYKVNSLVTIKGYPNINKTDW